MGRWRSEVNGWVKGARGWKDEGCSGRLVVSMARYMTVGEQGR